MLKIEPTIRLKGIILKNAPERLTNDETLQIVFLSMLWGVHHQRPMEPTRDWEADIFMGFLILTYQGKPS